MTAHPALAPFPLGDVRIHDDSIFARARDEMLHLARVYPVDRLLAVFRANAGLDTRGASAPGSWEDFGHPQEDAWGPDDYPGRDAAQTANLLRGHYAGHFLSMLSLAYVGTGDPLLGAKVDEMVAGLADVQHALAATGRYSHPGFLAAYGEWQFERLEHFAPYGEIWAPYYTCHKIMAGLIDAYELAGSAVALEIATAMGDWVAHRLTRLDHDRIQRMWSLYIAGEYGGMNESLARLAALTGHERFLAVARLFDQDTLLDAGAAGRDILTDMHANQHLPQLLGYLHEYEQTGDARYLRAVEGLWRQIVPGRIYAHGGTGESELWGPPDTVAGDIGQRNAETCATYNLLKIARLLFRHTQDPAYMAYYETAMFNHILGSRRAVDSDDSPEVTYMFPVHPGAVGEFDNVGTCCGGTGLENHVKYQDTVFLRSVGAPELWVNLYVPSTLDWSEAGVRVVLTTDVPRAGSARLTIESGPDASPFGLRLRIPEWVDGPATVCVNGVVVGDREPGGYFALDRAWHDGDVIEVALPMALRAPATIDDPGLRAMVYGPSVLAAQSDATTTLDLPLAARRDLAGRIVPGDDADPIDGVTVAGETFAPVWTGTLGRYHLYVRARDEVIGFLGAPTTVPVRRRDDGTSLLDAIWTAPAPAARAAFLDRVGEAVAAARRDGLLSQDELVAVLTAAARAEVDPDEPGRHARTVIGAGPLSHADADGTTVWSIPAELEAVALRPIVDLIVPAPAPSGWHTSAPSVVPRVHATEDAVRVEAEVDGGGWHPVDGAVELTSDGVHTVAVRATDPAGRTGQATRELAVDTAPPLSHATVRLLGTSAEITLTAADDVSGVDRIQWEGPGTFWATFHEAFVRALTDEPQIIEFAATDRAGNAEERRRLVLPALGSTSDPAPHVTWM